MKEAINFGYLPREYSDPDNSQIVIVPVAYDGTSTWLKGADKGPAAVIEASANMELYDIETDSEVYRIGIFTEQVIAADVRVEQIVEAVSETVKFHLEKDKFVVVIGGEHSISIGAVKAHAERHRDLSILVLDAHADLREEYDGSRHNHACTMARAKEFCPIVQVGVRSMDASEKKSINRENVFFAKDIHSNNDWVERVVSKLSGRVYITIDLDAFDPAVVPSVGTPEPGGLFWYDVLELLRSVCRNKDVVGFDVVELCPDERNKASDFLAAKLVYKLLSYKFRS